MKVGELHETFSADKTRTFKASDLNYKKVSEFYFFSMAIRKISWVGKSAIYFGFTQKKSLMPILKFHESGGRLSCKSVTCMKASMAFMLVPLTCMKAFFTSMELIDRHFHDQHGKKWNVQVSDFCESWRFHCFLLIEKSPLWKDMTTKKGQISTHSVCEAAD